MTRLEKFVLLFVGSVIGLAFVSAFTLAGWVLHRLPAY